MGGPETGRYSVPREHKHCQEGTINPSCLWSQDPLWGKGAMTFHVLPFLSFFFAVVIISACFLMYYFFFFCSCDYFCMLSIFFKKL